MPWAMVGAAVISGYLGSKGSKDAAGISAGASSAATQAQMSMFQQMARGLAPFRGAGGHALQELMFRAGLGPDMGLRKDIAALRKDFTTGGIGATKEQTFTGTLVGYEDSGNGGAGTPLYRYEDGTTGSERVKIVPATPGTQRFDEKGFNVARRDLMDDYRQSDRADQEGSLLQDFAFDRSDLRKDPGYQFLKQQGETAITRAAAARGLAASTPGLKELSRFNQGLASTHFDEVFRRQLGVHQVNRDNTTGLLMSLAGMGQNAAAQTGSAGMQAGNTAANAILAGGATGANAAMTGAASWNNAIQGGIGNYLYQQRFDDMMKRFPVFGSGGSGLNFTGGSGSWYAANDPNNYMMGQNG